MRQGERGMSDYEIFDAGDVVLQKGRDAEGREARLQDLRHAQREEGQRHHPADLVFRPPHRRGMDHRRGSGPRPQALFHHRAEHAGQRALVFAQQHARALRQGALPPRDGLRQCAPAASPRHRAVRNRADQAGDRLVHGRAPDPSTGAASTPTWWSASCRPAAPPSARATTSCSWKGSRRRSPPTTPGRAAGTRHRPPRGCGPWRGSMRAGASRRPSTGWREDLALGFSSLEDFLVAFWEGFFIHKDANNLLTMLWTWQNGDIGDNELYGGDFKKALGAIKAKAFVMPGAHRPLLPARGQRDRGRQHAERGAPRVRGPTTATSPPAR